MADSSHVQDTSLAAVQAPVAGGARESLWKKLKTAFARTVFWSYERGTIQYDVFVLAILMFIFLTPARLFNDRPQLQLTDLRHRQGVVEVAHGKEGWHYLVDARLVESMGELQPEEAIQAILRDRLRKPFTVRSIVPIRDKNNVILGYTVLVMQ